MKNMFVVAVVVSTACGAWSVLRADPGIERVMRAPRYTRGNTGILPVQDIDQAAWLTHPEVAGETLHVPMPRVVRFRRTFKSNGRPLEFDVTADERFYLTLDGKFVARGPNRGTVENWTYQTYRAELAAGEHVMEATVWKLPDGASPLAQMSHRLGFCLKAAGAYDAELTTGRAAWECGAIVGVKNIGRSGGVFGVGEGFELVGTGLLDATPVSWKKPAVVRAPMGKAGAYGIRQQGWLLFPSQLPDQIEDRVCPGRFVTGGEKTFPFTVKAGEKRTILWDLDRYICAYPEAVVKGGKGGRMTWKWAEALRGPSKDPKIKGNYKGNRNEWQGKTFDGFGDRLVFDGRAKAIFQPPWFRCGRWCELVIEAGAEDVTIEDLALVESRYPLSCETLFESPEDPKLAGVQRISERSMQMCCHEMLFDCPYYEQQMYPGDTRVQLNIISSMTSDDAIIRRAIEIYDINRRDDGNVPFNFPTTGTQEGATYTLCYLGMYPDYLMNHSNREWLRARLPGLRDTLSGFELYERADGVIANLPGWSFMDWVPRPGWDGGWAPGSRDGGANCEANLFYLAALQGAAKIEEAFGNAHLAAHWRAKAQRLAPAIVKTFFVEARGLFSSDAAHAVFAEHAQCLALLTDVFAGAKAQALFDRLVDAKENLCPTSVYFSYYLFEAYFKFGRGDLFQKRLDMWKGYVDLGATTCLEAPEYPGHDSRSDCHAWGAHPLWFLRTGVAGIRSAAPFYAKVKVAPQPGALKTIKASYPHPSGTQIVVDLAFVDGVARGTVTTPVAGTFVYGGRTVELKPGVNAIGRDASDEVAGSPMRAWVAKFNATDDELYTNDVPNAAAADFLERNVPAFACPDEDVERTYWFRWWTYRKHLHRAEDGTWVVSEFLPHVGWGGKGNTIACPLIHHLREGRWLRNPQYMEQFLNFMLEKGNVRGPRAYASAPAWSACELAKTTGRTEYPRTLLAVLVKNYEAWEKGWSVRGLSLRDVGTASNYKGPQIKTGYRAERGLFDYAGDREGSEFALSHDGARPMVNSMMWAEAASIAALAREVGDAACADRFAAKAAELERNVKAKLWLPERSFFTTLSTTGVHDDVCELNGYAPFYFGMDLKGFGSAWKGILDEKGFLAPKGLTFPRRDTPGFDVEIDPGKHECLWNGPSWPYATSVALTGLYRTLQRGLDCAATQEDYARLVKQYAAQQVLTRADGTVVPWIDENVHPFTGEWIARRVIIEWDRSGKRKMVYRERGKDYNHSTFCDLVIAGLCGVEAQTGDTLVVDPLAPRAWDWWQLSNVRYHGHDVDVMWDRTGTKFGAGAGLVVRVDGRERARSSGLGKLVVKGF